jgi:hypothetical protein
VEVLLQVVDLTVIGLGSERVMKKVDVYSSLLCTCVHTLAETDGGEEIHEDGRSKDMIRQMMVEMGWSEKWRDGILSRGNVG